MPKISVLMSVFNDAATVEKSIDSILNQSFADFELIICDDGSTDNTKELVRQKQKEDGRIIFIENDENCGLSYSLNHCLSKAVGEYCARMDGDDLCDAERFQVQSDFLDEHPQYAFVSSTMKRFDEQGIYSVGNHCVSEPTPVDFIAGSPFCHAPVMIRTAAYQAVNGYRDIDRTRGVEDYDLWFRLYAAGYCGYNLNMPLYSMFDGRDADKRRTWRRRKNEAWVRFCGYRMLKLPKRYYVYALKPILLGMLPMPLYRVLHRKHIQKVQ